MSMETFVILKYPAQDIRSIEQMVEARDSFVALLDGDLYRLVHHIAQRSEFKFSAILDRNVYTRITALIRGEGTNPPSQADLRWAAAILAFCQIADITFDYSSSLYEFAWTRGGAEALKEMERIRITDNSDPQIFIDFALGRSTTIPQSALVDAPDEKAPPPAAEFEKRLSDFRINYTFALKIAELSRHDIPSAEKMIRFLDWMYADFFFGSAALLFASRYFSPNRHKRMIKGLSKPAIENAAWDMTLVQGWRRRALKGAESNEPVLLISGDKAVQDMARRMVADSEYAALTSMREVWGRNTRDGIQVYEHYERLWQKVSDADGGSRRPPKHDTQIAIMQDLEREVLILKG